MSADADPGTFVGVLRVLAQSVADLETQADASAEMPPEAQADAIALVKDLRQRLGAVEADLSTTLGRQGGPIQGNLSDGRQFTLKRTQDRKAWDHDDWKRDARREVVRGITDHVQIVEDLVDVRTGEVVALAALLHEAIATAQEVHGSTAPRTTALKRLGLYVGDYCESSPGGWTLNVIKPNPTPTTTEKDTTDA